MIHAKLKLLQYDTDIAFTAQDKVCIVVLTSVTATHTSVATNTGAVEFSNLKLCGALISIATNSLAEVSCTYASIMSLMPHNNVARVQHRLCHNSSPGQWCTQTCNFGASYQVRAPSSSMSLPAFLVDLTRLYQLECAWISMEG